MGPIGEFEIGGDEQGHSFVESGAELEYQLGASRREGDKAQLIQNDEVLFEGQGQEFGQAVLVLGQDEFIDQGGGIVEADAIALATGSQGQTGADMGFSSTMTMPP